MNSLSLFYSVFEKNEYRVYSSPINRMMYAVAPKVNDNHLTVVVFLNNIAKEFVSALEFPYMEETIRNCNHVPNDDTVLNFLYVIWDTGKNKNFKGSNIIYIDSDKNMAYPQKLSKYSGEAVAIIDQLLCYDRAKSSLNLTRFGALPESHKVCMTWCLICLNILIYAITRHNAAAFGYSIQGVANGYIFGILTYMFVHANLAHLICNMASLYCIGSMLEEYIGAGKFLFLYLISGIFGALTDFVVDVAKNMTAIIEFQDYSILSSTITVGASGAICGLLTAMIVKILMTPKNQRIYRVSSLFKSIIIIIFSGMIIPNINTAAHIGGMISGIIYMFIFCMADKADYYRQKAEDVRLVGEMERKLNTNTRR